MLTNASNDLTFDSVEPPLDTSTPKTWNTSTPLRKKAALTVSIEIHKGAIFDRLKIIVICMTRLENGILQVQALAKHFLAV
jgi:hypothetical protein